MAGAPKGKPQFMVSAEGYAMSGAIALSADREGADGGVASCTCHSGLWDAVTHANVGAFEAIPGSPVKPLGSLSYGRDGQFTLRLLEEGPHALLFEADGYESRVEVPREVDGVLRCDVELRPMVNRGPLRGLVLDSRWAARRGRGCPAGHPRLGVTIPLGPAAAGAGRDGVSDGFRRSV